MTKTICILAIGIISAIAPLSYAQKPSAGSPADSIAKVVDSLFIRAASGTVQFKNLVEPSKKAIIEMGAAAIPQMLTKLKTSDALEMQVVGEIFKGIGEPAVDSLVNHIVDKENFSRRLAIRSLGEIKSQRAVEPLMRIASHADFRTRAESMAALGNIGSAQAAIVVMKGLGDQVEIVATAAAVACGKIKEGIDPQVLIQALSHNYYGVRYSACKSLSQLGEISVEPILTHFQANPYDLSAGYIIEALGLIGSDKSLPVLELFLKSEDWATRGYVAEALGNFKDKKVRKILSEAAKTETHPFVISRIKLALMKLDKANGS